MPQVLANYFNRSTQGWSIYQIILDLIGGIFSLAQLGVDSYLQHDWSGVKGNPVKFSLANICFVFDLIFFVQHYYLYNGVYSKEGVESEAPGENEEGPLLRSRYEDP
jgi:cystinosin